MLPGRAQAALVPAGEVAPLRIPVYGGTAQAARNVGLDGTRGLHGVMDIQPPVQWGNQSKPARPVSFRRVFRLV